MTPRAARTVDLAPVDHAVQVGPIAVRTDAAAVEAFTRALGMKRGYGPVPLSFPIRWLSVPDMHDQIAKLLRVPPGLLVQWSQSFDYSDELEVDQEYSFAVVIQRKPTSANRITLFGVLRDRAGDVVMSSRTVLCVLTPGTGARTGRLLPRAEAGPIPDFRIGPINSLQTQRYAAASLDNNPLHSDSDAARAAGLDRPIVHGMLVFGQFERVLMAWRRDLKVLRFNGTFLQPLPIDTGITLNSRVATRRRDNDGERLVVRIGVRTDEDIAVCVGEAEVHTASGAPKRG